MFKMFLFVTMMSTSTGDTFNHQFNNKRAVFESKEACELHIRSNANIRGVQRLEDMMTFYGFEITDARFECILEQDA